LLLKVMTLPSWGYFSAGITGKQQLVLFHDPVNPFVVHRGFSFNSKRLVQMSLNTPVTIGRSFINKLPDHGKKPYVIGHFVFFPWSALTLAALGNIRPGHLKRLTDSFHGMSSLGNKANILCELALIP